MDRYEKSRPDRNTSLMKNFSLTEVFLFLGVSRPLFQRSSIEELWLPQIALFYWNNTIFLPSECYSIIYQFSSLKGTPEGTEISRGTPFMKCINEPDYCFIPLNVTDWPFQANVQTKVWSFKLNSPLEWFSFVWW